MLYTLARNYVLERLAEGQTWLAIIAGILADFHLPPLNGEIVNGFVHAGVALAVAVGIGIKQGWTAKGSAK